MPRSEAKLKELETLIKEGIRNALCGLAWCICAASFMAGAYFWPPFFFGGLVFIIPIILCFKNEVHLRSKLNKLKGELDL